MSAVVGNTDEKPIRQPLFKSREWRAEDHVAPQETDSTAEAERTLPPGPSSPPDPMKLLRVVMLTVVPKL